MSYKARDKSDRYRDDDRTLDVYLEEIGKIDLITAEEERELGRRIHQSDEKALEKLVKSNLRFVVTVAKQYQNQGLSLLDLIAEGNAGLISAARKYDETKGFKFISYAVWWIKQAILQALAEQGRVINIPQNIFDQHKRLKKANSTIEQRAGYGSSVYEAGEAVSIDHEKVELHRRLNLSTLYLDDEPYEREETSHEFIADTNIEDSDDSLIADELSYQINESLNQLELREAEILRLYFGINCDRPHTLKEIGDIFRLSRERIRQIKYKAIRKLRRRKRILEPYY